DDEPVVGVSRDFVEGGPIARIRQGRTLEWRRIGATGIAGVTEFEHDGDVVGRGITEMKCRHVGKSCQGALGAMKRAKPSTARASRAGPSARLVPAAQSAPVPAHRMDEKASHSVAPREAT